MRSHRLHVALNCILRVQDAVGILGVQFAELVITEVCPAHPTLREVFRKRHACVKCNIRLFLVSHSVVELSLELEELGFLVVVEIVQVGAVDYVQTYKLLELRI